jgi:hypothetical protein
MGNWPVAYIFEEEEDTNTLPGIEPHLLGRSARRLVALPTELSRLPLYFI